MKIVSQPTAFICRYASILQGGQLMAQNRSLQDATRLSITLMNTENEEVQSCAFDLTGVQSHAEQVFSKTETDLYPKDVALESITLHANFNTGDILVEYKSKKKAAGKRSEDVSIRNGLHFRLSLDFYNSKSKQVITKKFLLLVRLKKQNSNKCVKAEVLNELESLKERELARITVVEKFQSGKVCQLSELETLTKEKVLKMSDLYLPSQEIMSPGKSVKKTRKRQNSRMQEGPTAKRGRSIETCQTVLHSEVPDLLDSTWIEQDDVQPSQEERITETPHWFAIPDSLTNSSSAFGGELDAETQVSNDEMEGFSDPDSFLAFGRDPTEDILRYLDSRSMYEEDTGSLVDEETFHPTNDVLNSVQTTLDFVQQQTDSKAFPSSADDVDRENDDLGELYSGILYGEDPGSLDDVLVDAETFHTTNDELNSGQPTLHSLQPQADPKTFPSLAHGIDLENDNLSELDAWIEGVLL